MSSGGLEVSFSIVGQEVTGVKLDGKSIWKIHMDFFFENPFFLNLF